MSGDDDNLVKEGEDQQDQDGYGPNELLELQMYRVEQRHESDFSSCTRALLMNSERIQMDLVPCKCKQFRIRSRVNTTIKIDRIQNYPYSFGSDLYPTPCKRGHNCNVHESSQGDTQVTVFCVRCWSFVFC